MTYIVNLNALAGGLFIIAAFGILATRQIRACLKLFILQSLLLAASALLLGLSPFSIHLMAVAAINLVTKVVFLPWLLRRLLNEEVYTRREISQAITIPSALLIALMLTIGAYYFSLPWVETVSAAPAIRINVPIGLAGLLIGALTLTTRREAVSQLLGLLAMENGAFFAGIAIAQGLPLIAELALAFDVLVLIFVAGVLTRAVHERTGSTAVGRLSSLREEPRK
jgi:hydrogenase-4 component E